MFVCEGRKRVVERKPLTSHLMGIITCIPGKCEQCWCLCPLSLTHRGKNMHKVLGAPPTSDFLSLVYLLICVTVMEGSVQANESSQVCPGISDIFAQALRSHLVCGLLSPRLLPCRPRVASWPSGALCSRNQLLEVPEVVPVLPRRCRRWPGPPALLSDDGSCAWEPGPLLQRDG